MHTLSFALALALTTGLASPPPDRAIDVTARRSTVEVLAKVLHERYVSMKSGDEIGQRLLEKSDRDGYRQGRARAFADAVTRDMQALVKDRHLRLLYDPRAPGPAGEGAGEEKQRFAKVVVRENFGVHRVEVLAGNVGLLDLRAFVPIGFGTSTLTAAMNLLANTDALIIDLRLNSGGDPDTVAFLCTYFFAERVHLNDIYWRHENETRQSWTRTRVSGPRYLDKPIYVLTSAQTASGAEELGYDLQAQKRATIVGETTWGGANPGGPFALGGGFVVWVSTGRSINPLTGGNWEGVGVKPDVPVPAARALHVAHLAALRALSRGEADPERRTELERTAAAVARGPTRG